VSGAKSALFYQKQIKVNLAMFYYVVCYTYCSRKLNRIWVALIAYRILKWMYQPFPKPNW